MKNNQKGFTLIEVLAVIATLGILATLLVPAVGNALAKARRARAMNNLQQIGLAYVSVSLENEAVLFRQAERVADWAGILARLAGINNPRLYSFEEDYLQPGAMPGTIGRWENGKWVPNAVFQQTPLSLTFIVGISPTAAADTTPLAYSRGLDPDKGVWKSASGEDGGVYGTDGGFILFLDGHVEFFSTLNDEHHQLVDFVSGESTSDIRKAVNAGAKAVNWKGVVWTN